jgi:hypothetical protein
MATTLVIFERPTATSRGSFTVDPDNCPEACRTIAAAATVVPPDATWYCRPGEDVLTASKAPPPKPFPVNLKSPRKDRPKR